MNEKIDFTGIRDVDKLILLKLDDRSLLNACEVNKRLHVICEDENFWRDRVFLLFGEKAALLKLPEDKWSAFYIRKRKLTRKEAVMKMGYLANKNRIRKDVRDILLILLKKEKKITSNEKIYFSGEFDSNQTEFEKQSNHLEIGVIAKSKQGGLVGLRILRYIVDEHFVLFRFDEEDAHNEHEDIIDLLETKEEKYLSSFNLDEIFKSKFASGKVIQKTLKDVKTYTLKDLYYEFI